MYLPLVKDHCLIFATFLHKYTTQPTTDETNFWTRFTFNYAIVPLYSIQICCVHSLLLLFLHFFFLMRCEMVCCKNMLHILLYIYNRPDIDRQHFAQEENYFIHINLCSVTPILHKKTLHVKTKNAIIRIEFERWKKTTVYVSISRLLLTCLLLRKDVFKDNVTIKRPVYAQNWIKWVIAKMRQN